MNENEFEIDGVVYVSKRSPGWSCEGCALLCGATCKNSSKFTCYGPRRSDFMTVIFVEKQQ